MSYSNIKDAFNINYKIDETIKGLQTNYDPVVTTYANLKSSIFIQNIFKYCIFNLIFQVFISIFQINKFNFC